MTENEDSYWERAYTFTFGWEKGIVDHPHDRGKLTVHGITQKTYDRYRKRHRLPMQSVRKIELREHMTIMRSYWDNALCYQYDDPDVALCAYDAAVNSGPTRSIRLLQGAARGLVIDGIPGPRTVGRLNELSVEEKSRFWLLDRAIILREAFYLRLVERDQSQQSFIKGWLNRIDDMRKTMGYWE